MENYFSTHHAQPSEKWSSQYDDQKRGRAEICALYYKANPPYFTNLANKILNDDKFVPTEKQYRSICQNKFAMKVIKSYEDDPLYEIVNMVRFRKSYSDKNLNDITSLLT